MTKLNTQSDHPNQTVPSSQSASDRPLDAAAEPGPNAGQANGVSLLPSEEIDLLQKERDELKNQVLRSQADFANYQKRARQQADEVRTYAIGNLAQDVLGAIDNLERAIEALRASANQGITSGLDMVQKQLLGILAKYGVEPIAALEQPFDPNFHEAIMQQPSAEHPEGTIVAELGKGYKIHDRVLRPSKVAVSVKP
ncbi:MAG: nucleotide exchange factor GrpE [Planctomycetaceae bacterium]|nr:nucleotide exchange factor GrpE [Planctomycetaceae bacterium]MBV8312282.1 nucleotide exchange factor GrpE [Planctomycetaceae bacterium]